MHARAGFVTALASSIGLAIAAVAGSALAAGIETVPAVQLRITSDQGIDAALDAAAMGCSGGTGYTGFSVSCNGYGYDLGAASLDSLSVNFVVDPEVHLNISLTNTSVNPQTFTLEATLPTAAFLGPNLMGGSVAGSVQDLNGNGATLSSAAVYSALIDGGVVATLLTSHTSTVVNAYEFTNLGAAFGNTPQIPSAAAPAVLSEIGVRLSFRLSPGDQAALLGVFVVQTPEPAIGALLGVAGLALAALRRRSA
jgi:hypothetical protein